MKRGDKFVLLFCFFSLVQHSNFVIQAQTTDPNYFMFSSQFPDSYADVSKNSRSDLIPNPHAPEYQPIRSYTPSFLSEPKAKVVSQYWDKSESSFNAAPAAAPAAPAAAPAAPTSNFSSITNPFPQHQYTNEHRLLQPTYFAPTSMLISAVKSSRLSQLIQSLLMFLTSYLIIVMFLKPRWIYNRDGTLREFGIGYNKKTILPLWLLSLFLGIICFAVVHYLTN